MATSDEIRTHIETMDIYPAIQAGDVGLKCVDFSDAIRERLAGEGIPVLQVGSAVHVFLLVGSEDKGVLLVDATAHQFAGEGGPREWICLPVAEALEHINNLPDMDSRTRGYWRDVQVIYKPFTAEYGVGLSPEESAFFAYIAPALAEMGMHLVNNLTEETNRKATEKLLDKLMVTLDALPGGWLAEYYASSGQEFVTLRECGVEGEDIKALALAQAQCLFMKEGDREEVTRALTCKWCPEEYRSRPIQLLTPEQTAYIENGGHCPPENER